MVPKTPSIRCPLGVISVGGKIKLHIGRHLLNGPKRFGELLRLMSETSRQMLTLQLRDFEQLGIIERKAFPQIPARVEYSLSEHGKALEPMLRQMQQWEDEFPWILQSREECMISLPLSLDLPLCFAL